MVGGGSGRAADGTPTPSLSSSTTGPGLGLGATSLSDRLRDAGLPASLCTVITSLLDAADPAAPDRYKASAEVESDPFIFQNENETHDSNKDEFTKKCRRKNNARFETKLI